MISVDNQQLKPELVLIGGGGHCKSCIDVIESEGSFCIEGIVDKVEKRGEQLLGYNIFASDEDIDHLRKTYAYFFITIGQIKGYQRRVDLYAHLKLIKAVLPSIFSPMAHISKHATVGEGTIVMHGAIVNAGAVIGNNCIINSNALIEHDVEVGDHCHISTGAVLNGGVKVGAQTFIGSNTTIMEGIKIGAKCVIGFGLKLKEGVNQGITYTDS